MSDSNRIHLGGATRAHGLKGHALCHIPSGKDTHLKKGHRVWLMPLAGSSLPKEGREFEVEEMLKGNELRLKLVGVVDRTALEQLLPFEIYCERSQLPPLKSGEYYLMDLMGLRAIDPSGAHVGEVSEYFETPGHLVLTIKLLSGESVDVPYVKHFFPSVDLEQGTIQVLLPEEI